MEVIRVYMLEVGDRFIHLGKEYIVTKINTRIHYKPVVWYHKLSFGLNSQERVLLITPPARQ